MQIVKLAFLVAVFTFSFSGQPAEASPPDITGVYALHREDQQGGMPVEYIKISAQMGSQFLIGIAVPTGKKALDWEGRGAVDEKGGSYEWVYANGNKGRTTFTFEPGGKLKLVVKGSDFERSYVALPISPSREQADLVGSYVLYPDANTSGPGAAQMSISAQRGGQFLVGIAVPTGNPGMDWEGRGTIDGKKGHYDWVFPDGKKGRTTISITADGMLLGEVRGADIDWNYVGKRLEGPLKLTVKKPAAAHDLLLGKAAPDFESDFAINGKRTRLSELKGKVVLVNFWEVGSASSVKSLPRVSQWHKAYKARGLEVVGVTFYNFEIGQKLGFDKETGTIISRPEADKESDQAMLKDFAAHHQLDFLLLTLAKAEALKTFDAYAVNGLPQLVLIDREGIVRLITASSEEDSAADVEREIKNLTASPGGESKK